MDPMNDGIVNVGDGNDGGAAMNPARSATACCAALTDASAKCHARRRGARLNDAPESAAPASVWDEMSHNPQHGRRCDAREQAGHIRLREAVQADVPDQPSSICAHRWIRKRRYDPEEVSRVHRLADDRRLRCRRSPRPGDQQFVRAQHGACGPRGVRRSAGRAQADAPGAAGARVRAMREAERRLELAVAAGERHRRWRRSRAVPPTRWTRSTAGADPRRPRTSSTRR